MLLHKLRTWLERGVLSSRPSGLGSGLTAQHAGWNIRPGSSACHGRPVAEDAGLLHEGVRRGGLIWATKVNNCYQGVTGSVSLAQGLIHVFAATRPLSSGLWKQSSAAPCHRTTNDRAPHCLSCETPMSRQVERHLCPPSSL